MATRLIAKTIPLKTNELNFSNYSPRFYLTELCGNRLEKYKDLFILFSSLNGLRKNRIECAAAKAEISYSIEKYNLCSHDQENRLSLSI